MSLKGNTLGACPPADAEGHRRSVSMHDGHEPDLPTQAASAIRDHAEPARGVDYSNVASSVALAVGRFAIAARA